MTPEELQKYKQSLEQEKEEIEQELGRIAKPNPLIEGDYVTKIGHADDSEEKAEELSQYAVDKPVEENFEVRLKAINEALEKINAGTYGKCTNCGNDIATKRLEALPTASLCADCAQQQQPAHA